MPTLCMHPVLCRKGRLLYCMLLLWPVNACVLCWQCAEGSEDPTGAASAHHAPLGALPPCAQARHAAAHPPSSATTTAVPGTGPPPQIGDTKGAPVEKLGNSSISKDRSPSATAGAARAPAADTTATAFRRERPYQSTEDT